MTALRIKTIDDTDVITKQSKKTQTLLLSYGVLMYRILVNHDSYQNQSYVRLEVMSTDRSWTVLKTVNPYDYTGTSHIGQTSYSGCIADLKKIIKKTYEFTPKPA